jgi:hypothetical protein
MTKEWKGETVYMPEAFGIKSGKKPELWSAKSKLTSLALEVVVLTERTF